MADETAQQAKMTAIKKKLQSSAAQIEKLLINTKQLVQTCKEKTD